MKHVAAFAVLATVLILSVPTRAAASCSVVASSSGPPAQIRADGAVMPVPPSRDVSDCSGLVVSAGQVLVLFETAQGERQSQPCAAGGTGCAVPGGTRGVLNAIRAKLGVIREGAPERRPGGRRYDEDAQRLTGMPSGKIYSLERAGIFDFRAAGSGPWSLVLTRDPGRAPIFQWSGRDPVIQLPANLFQRGGKYGWVLTAGGKRYAGGFDVLGASQAAEVERDLREAGVTGAASTRKQQVDELMVLFDHDLDHEVRLLYGQLGL